MAIHHAQKRLLHRSQTMLSTYSTASTTTATATTRTSTAGNRRLGHLLDCKNKEKPSGRAGDRVRTQL